MGRRRRFSQEFKMNAVSMVVDQGRDLIETAHDLDIRPDMLRKWKKKYESDGGQAFPGSGHQKPKEKVPDTPYRLCVRPRFTLS